MAGSTRGRPLNALRQALFLRPHSPLGGGSAIVLALALGPVYAATLAPGLTWLHHSADGGDLIAAAASGGVAHPTGYPLYLLLARLALWLPDGEPAFRTNLLSSVCGVLAAVVVGDCVWAFSPAKRRESLIAAILSAMAFGCSALLWSQAVVTEVYTLQALLVALGIRALPWTARRGPAFVWGVVTGLGLTNHLTALFLLPGGLGLVGRGRALAWTLSGLGLGLLPYTLLPAWAAQRPAINWGDASTARGFLWLVTGEPYRGLAFNWTEQIGSRLSASGGVWLAQFGPLGLVLSLGGLLLGRGGPAGLRPISIWLLAAFTIFAIGYNTADSYTYLIPAVLVLAIWFGLGLAEWLGGLGWGLGLAAMAVLLMGLANAIPTLRQVDASADVSAELFIRTVSAQAPPGAILLPTDDRDTFALWYGREAVRQRRDLIVIVERLAQYDWYREQLGDTYPELLWPDQADPEWLTAALYLNARPVCRTVLDQVNMLVCDSLPMASR